MEQIEVESMSEVPENYTGVVLFDSTRRRGHDGMTAFFVYENGKRHNPGGPACEWNDGEKGWYLEGEEFLQINLEDFVVLDYYKGKYDIMWCKLLDKNEIIEYPDIPGLIMR